MEILGGQPLIGGVAFRSTRWRVAARRRANGEIAMASGPMAHSKLLEMPFVRSFLPWFVDSPTEMAWAAAELEKEFDSAGREANLTAERGPLPPPVSRRVSRVLFGVLAACAAPPFAAGLILQKSGLVAGPSSLMAGAMTFAVFLTAVVLHLLAVPRLASDIRKVFQYNAAFNMALWSANEPGAPTTRKIARNPSWHYRSALVAMVLDALVLAFVPAAISTLLPSIEGDWRVALGLRLLLFPLVVIVVEEGLRALARLGPGGILRVVFAPLVLLNHLVVRPPTDNELEVAAAALGELRRLHDENLQMTVR